MTLTIFEWMCASRPKSLCLGFEAPAPGPKTLCAFLRLGLF